MLSKNPNKAKSISIKASISILLMSIPPISIEPKPVSMIVERIYLIRDSLSIKPSRLKISISIIPISIRVERQYLRRTSKTCSIIILARQILLFF